MLVHCQPVLSVLENELVLWSLFLCGWHHGPMKSETHLAIFASVVGLNAYRPPCRSSSVGRVKCVNGVKKAKGMYRNRIVVSCQPFDGYHF